MALMIYITQESSPLIIVSDDSMLDHTLNSAFAWTIAMPPHTMLWTGEGTVPCERQDIYSGRAEGYGLLTAIHFLLAYIKSSNTLILWPTITLKIYCDNMGIIQLLNNTPIDIAMQPSTAIMDHYNLIREIQQTTNTLPLLVSYHHVKGHQDTDETPIQKLPLEA